MVHNKAHGGVSGSGEGEATAGTSDDAQRKKRFSTSLSQLILQTFEAYNPRKRLSLAALKKHLSESGYNVNRKNNHRLRKELHTLVSNGLLTRVTGSGASGSFKTGGRSQARKKPARSSSAAKGRKKVSPKKPPGRGREPPKQRKKQPAISKPKGLRGQPAGGANTKRPLKK